MTKTGRNERMMILAFLAGFMACLFVVMIFNARNIAAARRRRKKDSAPPKFFYKFCTKPLDISMKLWYILTIPTRRYGPMYSAA